VRERGPLINEVLPHDSIASGQLNVFVRRIEAGSLCDASLGAAARLEQRTIILTVTFRQNPGPCPGVVRTLEYDARVNGLEPGDYTLKVVHVNTRAGTELTVIERENVPVLGLD
jgi:hypothetical protein